jgi:hypothetical protein
MSKRCNCCARALDVTAPEARFRTVVYADRDGEPFMYLALWECRCQNTLSAVLWQDVECSLEEHTQIEAEVALAAEYERTEGPYNRAVERGFFSLTHELAELGL